MRDIITSKEFYIPVLIGTILTYLGIWLHDERGFFKQEWMFDLYFLFTMITMATVESFLLGKI